jgi:hypothetical protein
MFYTKQELLIHLEQWVLYKAGRRFRVMVFNATFNNISVISWRSVLFVEEIRVPRENPGDLVS